MEKEYKIATILGEGKFYNKKYRTLMIVGIILSIISAIMLVGLVLFDEEAKENLGTFIVLGLSILLLFSFIIYLLRKALKQKSQLLICSLDWVKADGFAERTDINGNPLNSNDNLNESYLTVRFKVNGVWVSRTSPPVNPHTYYYNYQKYEGKVVQILYSKAEDVVYILKQ